MIQMKLLKQMVMKKILTILAFFFLSYGFSQTGINYQAIIKNSSGNVYSNSTMVVTFSLRYDTSGGSVIYSETHNATSTSEGQISLVVGGGNKTSNGVNFSAIDFSRSIFYTTEVNIGGAGNILLGTQQLRSVSSAYFAKTAASISPDANDNVVIGSTSSMVSMTSGIAIGSNAVTNNTSGYSLTAVGISALRANTTGFNNTAMGNFASSSNTSGDFNVGVGNIALSLNTTGDSNTAVGYAALATNTIENNNTAIGFGAGNPAYVGGAYVTGNNNTYIGAYTQNKLTTSNSTAIGYGASISASNTIQLGDTAITDVLTSGVVSATGFQTTGTVTATSFVGDGSGLTNLPTASLNASITARLSEILIQPHEVTTNTSVSYPPGYSINLIPFPEGTGTLMGGVLIPLMMPSNWNRGNVTVTFYYSCSAADGDIYFKTGARRYGTGDVNITYPVAGFDLTPAAAWTLYKHTYTQSVGDFNANSVDDSLLIINFSRYGYQPQTYGDTNTGDMYIHGIRIAYSTN